MSEQQWHEVEDPKARAAAFLAMLDTLPPVDTSRCVDEPHRGPQGPNEDIGQCPRCWSMTGAMRPENEQIGLHLDDCSLPRRHRGYCEGGGNGHAPTEVVRGYWKGMDEDVAAARAKFANTPPPDATPDPVGETSESATKERGDED